MKTSRQQTSLHGEDASTCSQEAFPASPSRLQGEDVERLMTAISGQRCYEQSGKYSPLSSLAKTLLESCRWYNPAVSLEWKTRQMRLERVTKSVNSSSLRLSVKTSKRKDIPSSRLLFRLVPSAHRTGGTVSGSLPSALLPTPLTMDIEHPRRIHQLKEQGGQTMGSRKNGESRPNGLMDFLRFYGLMPTPNAADAHLGAIVGKNDKIVMTHTGKLLKVTPKTSFSLKLPVLVKLLPTPNAVEGTRWTTKLNPNSQMGMGLTARALNGLLPTPRANGQEGYETRARRKGHQAALSYLESAVEYVVMDNHKSSGRTSQLSPLFVAEMMGFPLTYLVLPFLSQNGGVRPSRLSAMPWCRKWSWNSSGLSSKN